MRLRTPPEPGHTPTQSLSTMSASPADRPHYAEIRTQVSAGRTATGTGYYESFQPPSIAAA